MFLAAVGCTSGSEHQQGDADAGVGSDASDSEADASPMPTGFAIVKTGVNYVATSYAAPGLSVEIDCDDVAGDDHYFGITPVINGRRLDGPLWDSHFGLITPDFDAGAIQCTGVENVEDRLIVKFEAGSYVNLDGAGPDLPVPLDAEFYVDEDLHLVAELSGIYYMLPTTANTTVNLTYNGTTDTQTQVVSNPSTNYTLNFDGATFIDVSDSVFGHFTIETGIDRLQFQVRTVDPRFEFDLDHSFKDLGQEVVESRIVFY